MIRCLLPKDYSRTVALEIGTVDEAWLRYWFNHPFRLWNPDEAGEFQPDTSNWKQLNRIVFKELVRRAAFEANGLLGLGWRKQ